MAQPALQAPVAASTSEPDNAESFLHRSPKVARPTSQNTEREPRSPGAEKTSGVNGVPRNGNDASVNKDSILPTGRRELLRRVSLISKNRTRAPESRRQQYKFEVESPSSRDANGTPIEKPTSNDSEVAVRQPPDGLPEVAARPVRVRSMPAMERLATLARRSWISSSRSRTPSPPTENSPQRTSRSREQSPPSSPSSRSRRSSLERLRQKQDQPEHDVAPERAGRPRRRSVLGRKVDRPRASSRSRSRSVGPPSSVSSSFGKDSLETENVSAPALPPLPKPGATPVPAPAEPPRRKKDELWSVFRSLDADYQKFTAKSIHLKVSVIRSSLLPFLARYGSHPSVQNLRPEDLDRRVNILNKWWTGMLEILHGKQHNQAIAGTDRPAYLEAAAGIMMLPEWRIPFTAQTGPQETNERRASKSSLDSGGSEFVVESINHNIRNMFIQNLLSQMAFVVEKMSLRLAPASLVSFCGKACAYAFYFCPGVAEMLVRLWKTPSDVLRRVLAESSVHRGCEDHVPTEEWALNFPPAITSLAFSSHASLVRYLRQPPELPLSASRIPWNGPWTARWCGRETDLFFVFVKYFHILLCEFLPKGTPKSKRIFAPGVLLVHSQLLVVLEDTLYRQSGPQPPEPYQTSLVTFDDFVEGPDASMSGPSLPSANCQRSMATNRLIILLRDILSDSAREMGTLREVYAETFTGILQTAARKTSLFNHNACYVLCDFLEEAIPILHRYGKKNKHEVFDWEFWTDVCRRMMRSENSLTEMRVFAFVYAVWGTWTVSPERHRDLCLGLLLNDECFYRYFGHWNPMVRAFYHRLLCWRVARVTGENHSMEMEICSTLAAKLQQVWAYYVVANEKAAKQKKALIPTAPCSPAPGRRLLIIRTNTQPSPTNLMMSFDRVIPPTSSGLTLSSGGAIIQRVETAQEQSKSGSGSGSKWSLLKNMFSSSKTGPEPENPRPSSSESNNSDSEGDAGSTVDDRDRGSPMSPTSPPPSNEAASSNWPGSGPGSPQHHPPCSFKFSLEWQPPERRFPINEPARAHPPRLPSATYNSMRERQRRATVTTTPTVDRPSKTETQPPGTSAAAARPSTVGSSTSTASAPSPSYSTDEHQEEEQDAEAEKDTDRDEKQERRAMAEPKHTFAPSLIQRRIYLGRALAEWNHVVGECDSFFHRRRSEGVPSDRLVETPILAMDGVRK